MTARILQKKLGYTKWENFHNVIKKGIQLSKYDDSSIIKEIKTTVVTGKTAKRLVIDYDINEAGIELLKKVCYSSKPTNGYRVRNETFFINLISKYYSSKGYDVIFQFSLDKFIFDCKISNVLFEFDELHHLSKKQKGIDANKNIIANSNNYEIVRATYEQDIVDIFIMIDNKLLWHRANDKKKRHKNTAPFT